MPKSVQMFLALSIISLVSGVSLGGLFEATHELAEENILKFKKIPAVVDIYGVVEGEVNEQRRGALETELLAERKLVDIGEKEPLLLFQIKKDGQAKGVAIEGVGRGFGGKLGVMAGFDMESEQLIAIGITTMSETPGVGTRVKEAAFTQQFVALGKDVELKLKKDGGTLDGVSGATISSRAVAEALRNTRKLLGEHKAAIEKALAAPPTEAKP